MLEPSAHSEPEEIPGSSYSRTIMTTTGYAGLSLIKSIAKGTINLGTYMTGGVLGATFTAITLPFLYTPTVITYIPMLLIRPVATYYGFTYGGRYLAPACQRAFSFMGEVTIDGIKYTSQKCIALISGGYQILTKDGSPILKAIESGKEITVQYEEKDYHKVAVLLLSMKIDLPPKNSIEIELQEFAENSKNIINNEAQDLYSKPAI